MFFKLNFQGFLGLEGFLGGVMTAFDMTAKCVPLNRKTHYKNYFHLKQHQDIKLQFNQYME